MKPRAPTSTTAGLTQQELANKLKKPQSFVSSCEKGQRRIDMLELVVLADALGADPRRLFSAIVRRVRSSR